MREQVGTGVITYLNYYIIFKPWLGSCRLTHRNKGWARSENLIPKAHLRKNKKYSLSWQRKLPSCKRDINKNNLMEKLGSTSSLASLTAKMGLLKYSKYYQHPYMFLYSYSEIFRCAAALTFNLTFTGEKMIIFYVHPKFICSLSRSISFFFSSLFSSFS